MTGLSRQPVRIVTDTTASLPAGYAAAHGLEVVPQVVIFGEESLLEERELTSEEFVRRLRTSTALPKTAAPPPGEFIAAYERQLALGSTILSIHPSSEVSGTVRSAHTAIESSFVGADIRVLDTRTISSNLGSMVRLAVAWAEEGLDADAIMARLQAMIPRSRIYFLIHTLEFLQRGGRIGKAAALAGSLLQIKPILEFREGIVQPVEKVRTRQRAWERLIELVCAQCPSSLDASLTVLHVDSQQEAEQLAERLAAATGIGDIPLVTVGAAIATHAGPGTIGAGFFEA